MCAFCGTISRTLFHLTIIRKRALSLRIFEWYIDPLIYIRKSRYIQSPTIKEICHAIGTKAKFGRQKSPALPLTFPLRRALIRAHVSRNARRPLSWRSCARIFERYMYCSISVMPAPLFIYPHRNSKLALAILCFFRERAKGRDKLYLRLGAAQNSPLIRETQYGWFFPSEIEAARPTSETDTRIPQLNVYLSGAEVPMRAKRTAIIAITMSSNKRVTEKGPFETG